ncbi:MAG: efflux transporter outer membrane subunit [Deltaproteobacteria bacterium]|nr:efflux transporter outer membrane subunit [Deltaproteobacteria bacterium]
MIRKTLFCGVVAVLLCAGCTMAPEYSRPEAPVPEQWPQGPAYDRGTAPGETQAAADLPWRRFFTDPRLQAVIAAALENNRDLRLAALNVERARAYYRIQRADLLPKVNASGSGYQEHLPADLASKGQSMTVEQYGVNLGLNVWEIDFFGRIRSLEQAALEEYLATEEAARAARILLIAETANGWLTLAADREKLQLAQSTLETQQAAYQLIRRRYDVGLAQELDLRRAQTQVDAARVDLARLTQVVAQDQNALALLVGAPVAPRLWADQISQVEQPVDLAVETSSEVLLRRPDVLAAERRLKAANANIGAARAALFPRISLTTGFGTASAELSGLFAAGQDTWNFAPRIVMPIFDPRTWAALDITKVEREIILTQYEKAIQTAFREVADALARHDTVGRRLEAQRSLVEASSEAHRLSEARYTKGINSYLSVLEAQRSLYAARQGLITVRLADLAARVNLYAALGGGAS